MQVSRRQFSQLIAATAAIAPFGAGRALGAQATTTSLSAAKLATGGTEMLMGLPDPVFSAIPDCFVTEDLTLGPCFDPSRTEREDISDGMQGLPLQVVMRIVDNNCTPLPGIEVDVWHTDPEGIYSGDIVRMCNDGNAEAEAAGFGRGYQVTDENGIVRFKTTYPGWYPSRANHIHMRFVEGNRELLTSQMFFNDVDNDVVYQQHPTYAPRGPARTINATDRIFNSLWDEERNLLKLTQMDNGTLQASLTIGLRRS